MTTHLNTGGITTYLLTLIKEQTKAGHEVYVWGSPGERSENFKSCCSGIVPDVPRCKSELSPRLWAQWPRLVSFLKKNPVDIIHCHTRVAQVLAAASGPFVKIPYVYTAHMFYKPRLGRRLFPCWGKAVIAISGVVEEGLRTIFKASDLPPIVVVPNGMDVEKLRAKFGSIDRNKVRESYGYRKEDLVVLSLSRLIPAKGVHFLIEAFAMARKEVRELKLLVVGAGNPVYTQELRDRVAQLHLEADVLFLGNEPEIEKPLRAADVFVAPYLWEEPFGLSVLEAMAVGLPVAGAISGGLVELLGDGTSGLLFEKGNISDLASCFLRYAKDAPLRSRMGEAARRTALEYTSFKMCERIQRVYENVLKETA